MWEEEPANKIKELIMWNSQLPRLLELLINKSMDHPTIESKEATADPHLSSRGVPAQVVFSHFKNYPIEYYSSIIFKVVNIILRIPKFISIIS